MICFSTLNSLLCGTAVAFSLILTALFQRDPQSTAREITFEKDPPASEWHIASVNSKKDEFNILTVSLVKIVGIFPWL